MLDVLIDSLIDTLKLAPILIVVYILIELAERKFAGKIAKNPVLKSPVAPLVGAAAGIVPQCGFSVVSANLYAAGKITLGTLIAVFIATSDEAIPILLSDYKVAYKLVPLLIIKFVLAVAVGYAVHFLFKNGFKFGKKSASEKTETDTTEHAHTETDEHIHEEHDNGEHEHIHEENESESGDAVCVHGCHGHTVTGGKESYGWLFLHPLLHSLTVLGFIFVVNFALGTIVHLIGEDALTEFLSKTEYVQPFVAALIGLIPNCAASVVITELYALGGLTLGSAVAGLSAGAGIGYAVLIKENKSIKETIAIIAFMFVLCSLVGLIINLII